MSIVQGVRRGTKDSYPLNLDDEQNLYVVLATEVEAAFDHGSNSAIGVVPTRLTAASVPATLGVQVKAANGNTQNVYVGNADVTAATADMTDGFELGAGESILIRVDNVNRLYAIAAAAPAQRVFWLVV